VLVLLLLSVLLLLPPLDEFVDELLLPDVSGTVVQPVSNVDSDTVTASNDAASFDFFIVLFLLQDLCVRGNFTRFDFFYISTADRG